MKKFSIQINSVWSLVDTLIGSSIGFIISILLARSFTPDIFGKYTFFVTIASIVIALSSSGIAMILIREAVKKPWRFSHYVESVTSIFLFYSIPLISLISLILYILLVKEISFLLAMLFQIGMMFFGSVILIFINLKRSDISTFFNLTYRIILLITLLLFFEFLNFRLSLEFIFIFNFILLISIYFFSIKFYQNYFKVKLHFKFNYNLYKKYIFLSYPVLGAALAEFINLKIDTLMLGTLIGNFELGIYTAGYNIYLGFTLIALSLTKVYSPVFIEKSKNDLKSAKFFFYKYFILYLIYSLLVITFISIFEKQIIKIIYPKEYDGINGILFYLCIGLPFISINRLINYSMIGLGRQKYYFYYTLIGSVINICVNFYLIPIYGALGAVFATLLTEFVVFIFGLSYINYFFRSN